MIRNRGENDIGLDHFQARQRMEFRRFDLEIKKKIKLTFQKVDREL